MVCIWAVIILVKSLSPLQQVSTFWWVLLAEEPLRQVAVRWNGIGQPKAGGFGV